MEISHLSCLVNSIKFDKFGWKDNCYSKHSDQLSAAQRASLGGVALQRRSLETLILWREWPQPNRTELTAGHTEWGEMLSTVLEWHISGVVVVSKKRFTGRRQNELQWPEPSGNANKGKGPLGCVSRTKLTAPTSSTLPVLWGKAVFALLWCISGEVQPKRTLQSENTRAEQHKLQVRKPPDWTVFYWEKAAVERVMLAMTI